jgi:hypothetical protein
MCATMIQKRNNAIPSWNPSKQKTVSGLAIQHFVGTKQWGVFSISLFEDFSDNPPLRDGTELLIPSTPLTPYASPLTPDVSHPFDFAARGGDPVRLVCLVYRSLSGLFGSTNERDKTARVPE